MDSSSAYSAAVHEFGGGNLASFQNGMLAANTKGFLGQTRADIEHHPYRYVALSFGMIGLAFTGAGEAAGAAEIAVLLKAEGVVFGAAGIAAADMGDAGGFLNFKPY